MTKFFYLLNYDRHNKFRHQSKSIKELMALYNNSDFEIILESLSKLGEKRFGVEINIEFVGNLLYTPEISETKFINNFTKIIKQINLTWKQRISKYIKNAVENVKSFIRDEFIENRNNKVTLERKLIDNYFTVYEKNNENLIFLNSGDYYFDNNSNSFNFNENWDLLQRKVLINKNSLLLRYSLDFNSYIYIYMSQYIEYISSIFDGINIESLLTIPLYALEFLLQKARKVNQNLLTIASISCNEEYLESEYIGTIIKTVGINYIVKDTNFSDPKKFIEFSTINNIKGESSKYLVTDKTFKKLIFKDGLVANCYQLEAEPYNYIYFDQSVNNLTLNEKFNNLSYNLFVQTINSISNNAIGTVKGFDELFPYQPSYENEDRCYLIDRQLDNNINKLDKNEQILDFDTTEVKFEYYNEKSSQVLLALSCFQWKPNIFLQKIGPNKFSTIIRIPKGTHYYKYVLDDGKWVVDAQSPMEKDINGMYNNVINIFGINNIFNDLKLVRRQLNLVRKNILSEFDREVLNTENKLNIFSVNTNSNEIVAKICLINNFTYKCSEVLGYAMIWRNYNNLNNFNFNYSIEVPGEVDELVISTRLNVSYKYSHIYIT